VKGCFHKGYLPKKFRKRIFSKLNPFLTNGQKGKKRSLSKVARVSSKVQQLARRKRYCPLCLSGVSSVVKYQAQKLCFSVRLLKSTLLFVPACTTSQLVRNLQTFGLLCWVVALVICCPARRWNWKDEMFYLTLPSNSSMTTFHENSLSDYTTKLPMDMCLEGQWEVGVAEILYPHSWFNMVGPRKNFLAFSHRDGEGFTVILASGYYKNPQDIVDSLNKQVERSWWQEIQVLNFHSTKIQDWQVF